MVAGLRALLYALDSAVYVPYGGDCVEEERLGHVVGAGAGDEHAAE